MKCFSFLLFCFISLSSIAQNRISISAKDTAAINKTIRLYELYLDSVEFRPEEMLYVMKIIEKKKKARSYTIAFVLSRSTLYNYLIKFNYFYTYNNKPVILVGDYKVKRDIPYLTFMEDSSIQHELSQYVYDDRNGFRFFEVAPSLNYSTRFPNPVTYYLEFSNIPEKNSPFLMRKRYPFLFVDHIGMPTNFLNIGLGKQYYLEVVEEDHGEIIFKEVKSVSNPEKTIKINFTKERGAIKLIVKNPFDKQLGCRVFYTNTAGKFEWRAIGPIDIGKSNVEVWRDNIEKVSLENFKFIARPLNTDK